MLGRHDRVQERARAKWGDGAIWGDGLATSTSFYLSILYIHTENFTRVGLGDRPTSPHRPIFYPEIGQLMTVRALVMPALVHAHGSRLAHLHLFRLRFFASPPRVNTPASRCISNIHRSMHAWHLVTALGSTIQAPAGGDVEMNLPRHARLVHARRAGSSRPVRHLHHLPVGGARP
jgi:hypothetical protein